MAAMFNILVGSIIASAAGFSILPVVGAGAVLGVFTPSLPGHAGMAIQKEIWMTTIVEGLFADDTFLSKAYNADMFVNQGRTVHIPNAGAPSNVVENRATFPATVTVRTDIDLSFDLSEFTTDPIRIPHADTVELSYNKRESVVSQDKANLREKIGNSFLLRWSPTTTANIIRTTGANIAAHLPDATGERKSFTVTDLKSIMTRFNKDDVPQEERYLLLDADMYSQLLESMTEKEATAFHALADLRNGIVGKLYTFNVMMRSKSLRYTDANAPKAWTEAGAATDNAGGLAWHRNSVCRALGEVVPFENEGDPTYYGDIYSFLVRAGGRPMRQDVKGLIAIVQDVAAAEDENP